MDKIDWHPDADRLIFLGDYLDRGKNSKGVVDFILELSKLSRLVDCLIGNHENIFLNFLAYGEPQAFLANGGRTTLEI